MEDNRSLVSNGFVSNRSHTIQHADSKSVGNGESTASGTGNHSVQHTVSRPVYIAPKVAKKEEANIFRAKCLVAIILVLAAAAVATSAYILVEDQARSNFENQFLGYASEIMTVSRQKADQLFSALDAFSVMIGSQAATENVLLNSSWPFYTIPDFSVKSKRLVQLLGATVFLVTVSPVVHEHERDEWADYMRTENPVWFQESLDNEGNTELSVDLLVQRTVPYIHTYNLLYGLQVEKINRPGEVLPTFQQYPLTLHAVTNAMTIGYDTISHPRGADLYEITKETLRPTIGFTEFYIDRKTIVAGTQVLQPIYDTADTTAEDRKIVAILSLLLHWLDFFKEVLVQDQDGVVVVLRSACRVDYARIYGINATDYALDPEDFISEDAITYQIDGPDVIIMGEEDLHDPKYDDLEVTEVFIDLHFDELELPEGKCVPTLSLHVYPSEKLEATFRNSNAAIYASVVVVIFVFTSLVFLLYDYFVGRRQQKVMDRIVQQDQIVSNVFPTAIRDRLYEAQARPSDKSKREIDDGLDFGDGSDYFDSLPLADLFPNVTVVIADIVGFTAWSSAREPQQVFLLLESIYSSFDKIAYRHDIFKVETVGDCYVAAAGLPEPVKNHAGVACKFALDCLKKMRESTTKLEISLGPDTADLALRIGIHSGQVTAGVLRGERSRFQLFGDTMNTAARMEHSGECNRVQISQATADLLSGAGFSHWTTPRTNKIYLKGKGHMQTYWMRKSKSPRVKASTTPDDTVVTTESSELSEHSAERRDNADNAEDGMTKTHRLVEWTVAILTSLLQQIIASRGVVSQDNKSLLEAESAIGNNPTVLNEFVPIIPLKRFNEEELGRRRRPSAIDIGYEATSQLRKYLLIVAGMYQDNPFHNFEHAIHVTASVKKLLTRIVNMDERNGLEINTATRRVEDVDLVDLAGHSYGITSDPLTQFAVVLSAVIHDADHPGVPNTQLVKENTRCAQIYKKSVAEQKSVNLAWDALMSEEYSALRACIYQTESELQRFRQLVVNTVMATDIADKELQALRKARWETAFSTGESSIESSAGHIESEDRKATIVIEHLIQASDVSHTMQHWQIYRKWNEKFFMECYSAYKEGRADSDPSKNWYKGEIGFFDFYVIPLARKLQNCGVFGVSSDEYLNYATSNRDEWVREGEGMVQQYLAKYKRRAGDGY